MGGGYAWVTLATNDSYSLGALVLAHSLKQVGTQQQLAVLITPGVTGPMRTKLGEVFNVIKEVNILDSKDEANLKLLKRPELGITFTKLHCWRLTQFEKCVFLDADTLVLENCDELFEREELSAAPDIGWPDCFNSGVFVYRPSNDTYEKLIQFALEKGSFDGGDQGLLNLYFSDWAHKDISKHLPFIYNMSSTACYSYLPAFKQFGKNAKIIHFLGSSKPWLQYFNTETRKVHPSEGLNHLEQILQLWWNIFCDLIHPKLSTEMTSHTDTVHGSQSYTSQNLTHTSYYHHDHPNLDTAEDYQNTWDPWEEYEDKLENISSHNTNLEYSHTTHTEHHPQVETHTVQHIDNHTHHAEYKSDYHFNIDQSHTYIEPVHEQHIHKLETPSHSEFVERHIQSHNSHNQQNLIESHNTNAFAESDLRDHIHHPTHSQPQPPPSSPSNYSELPNNYPAYYEPPHNSSHDNSSDRPPPSDPRLPDECVATTTVSNEITLQTHSKEDSNDNQGGLAGAFANLTLGQARTPEQEALDDHLRRQGWEVGNIDYLGRDSFSNIWSKICETLSGETEKEASPPKTEEKSIESAIEPIVATPEKVEPVSTLVPSEPTQTCAQAEPLSAPAPAAAAAAATLSPGSPKPAEGVEQPAKISEPTPAEKISPPEPQILESQTAAPITQTPSPTAPTSASAAAESVAPAAAESVAPAAAESVAPAAAESVAPAAAESVAPVAAESKAPPTSVPDPTPAVPKQIPAPAAPAPVPTHALPEAVPTPDVPEPVPTPAAPEPVPSPAAPVPAKALVETAQASAESALAPAETAQASAESTPITPPPDASTQAPADANSAPIAPTPTASSTPAPSGPDTTPIPASPAASPSPVAVEPLKKVEVPKDASQPACAKEPKVAPAKIPQTPTTDVPKEVSKAPPAEATPTEAHKTTPLDPTHKVTEPTPPSTPKAVETTTPPTPGSPQPKSLGIDTSVPDTPPPAAATEAAAGPTPPPRKGSGTPKKSGGKKK